MKTIIIEDIKYYLVPVNKRSKKELEEFIDLVPITCPTIMRRGNKFIIYEHDGLANNIDQIKAIYEEEVTEENSANGCKMFLDRFIEKFKVQLELGGCDELLHRSK